MAFIQHVYKCELYLIINSFCNLCIIHNGHILQIINFCRTQLFKDNLWLLFLWQTKSRQQHICLYWVLVKRPYNTHKLSLVDNMLYYESQYIKCTNQTLMVSVFSHYVLKYTCITDSTYLYQVSHKTVDKRINPSHNKSQLIIGNKRSWWWCIQYISITEIKFHINSHLHYNRLLLCITSIKNNWNFPCFAYSNDWTNTTNTDIFIAQNIIQWLSEDIRIWFSIISWKIKTSLYIYMQYSADWIKIKEALESLQ